jgi:hypothetical protein
MLREIDTSQPPGEPPRRWFCGAGLDLVVWIKPNGQVLGFQLCYAKAGEERALTWLSDRGYTHCRVDDGESDPAKNQTPILVADGVFPKAEVLGAFDQQSERLVPEYRDFVRRKVAEYPS